MSYEYEELSHRLHDVTEALILSEQQREDEKEKYFKEKEKMVECPICKKEVPDLEKHFEDNPECKEAFKKMEEEKKLRSLAKESLDFKSRIGWEDRLTKEQKEDLIRREKIMVSVDNPDSQTKSIDKLFKDGIAKSLQLGNCPVCGISAEEIRIREGTEFVLSKKEKQELSDFTMGIGNWLKWLEKETKRDVKQVAENKRLSNDLIHVQIHLASKHPKTAKIIEQIFQIGKSGSGNMKADDDTHVREVKLSEKLSKRQDLDAMDREQFFKAWKLSLRKRKGAK